MPRPTRLLLALLAPALLTPVFAIQSEAPVVRLHDLRGLEMLGLPGDTGVDLRLPLQSSFLDSLEHDRGDEPQVPLESYLDTDLDSWISLVLEVLEAEGVEELFEIEPRGGFVRVTGSPSVQARIETLLTQMEAQLLRTVEIQAYHLAPGAGRDAGPVLDAAQTAALLAAHPPISFARARVPIGQRARMGALRWQAELYDFDVEVAQSAAVSDPQVTRLLSGLELGAVVLPLGDGDLLLRTWSRNTGPSDSPQRVNVDDTRELSVRLPRQESTLLVGSAVLEPGGGLLIGHDRHAGGLMLLRVSETSAPIADSPFVPVGALLAPPLVVSVPTVWGPQPSGGMYSEPRLQEHMESFEQRLFEDSWALEDHLREVLDLAGLKPFARVLGPVAYVPDAAARQRVAEHVAVWSEASLRTVSLDLRMGLVDASIAMAAQTGELTTEQLLSQLGGRATGACRSGDALMIVGGEERFYLQDYDVEIAEKATVGDPIVNDIFAGFTFWCRPTATRGGRVVAYTDLVVIDVHEASTTETVTWETAVRVQQDEPVLTPPPIVTHGDLELPVASRATLRKTTSLMEGEWTLLTVSDMPGTGQTLVAMLKAEVLD